MADRRPRREVLTDDIDDHPDPRDTISERLDWLALVERLRGLPIRQRAVALLDAYDYPAGEIAAIVGVSRRTVVDELAAGRRSLRLSFSQLGSHPRSGAGSLVNAGIRNPLRTLPSAATYLEKGHFARGSRVAMEHGLAINERLGAEGMIRCGLMVPVTSWIGPGRHHGHAVYIALKPLVVGGPDGGSRELAVGDLLLNAEAGHSAIALQALVDRHQVAELDATSGLVATYNAALFRIRALERTLASMVADEASDAA